MFVPSVGDDHFGRVHLGETGFFPQNAHLILTHGSISHDSRPSTTRERDSRYNPCRLRRKTSCDQECSTIRCWQSAPASLDWPERVARRKPNLSLHWPC